jgi:GNAT superfamily N-acetyltransferase
MFRLPPFAFFSRLSTAAAWRHLAAPEPTLRPVDAADAAAMRAFVETLSAASRRYRFHAGVQRCSDSFAQALCRADDSRALVLVAVAPTADGGGTRIVGEARCVTDADDGSAAEFAIAIADDWHGLGLAARLLAELAARALPQGVRWLYGDVLQDNERMQGLMHKLGFVADERTPEPGMVRFEAGTESLRTLLVQRRRSARGTGRDDALPARLT